MIDHQAAPIMEQINCREIVNNFAEKIQLQEKDLKAFKHLDIERLFREADQLDTVSIEERGPLHGKLIAVKEVFDVAGYQCSWGTNIHADRYPDNDAATVKSLKQAGALIAGITVSTEYAMSRTGPTVNPHDPKRTPGASSQGSAAVVGGGLVNAALASQTIGSIIRPAAYCGCIGVKPTWGITDVKGSMPLSDPLDHAGFITENPEITRLLYNILAPDLSIVSKEGIEDILIIEPWYSETTNPAVLDAVQTASNILKEAGHKVETAKIPDWISNSEEKTLDTILAYGMAFHHGKDYDSNKPLMSERICDYIERGRRLTERDYQAAMDQRQAMIREMTEIIDKKVALMPPSIGIAPLLEEGTGSRSPQRIWTLLGFPAMTVPFGTSQSMPIGVQVVSSVFQDYNVLSVVRKLSR